MLPHSSGAEQFPLISSEVPVLQKCLLALALLLSTSEKGLALQRHLQPHQLSLLWVEEASSLGLSLYAMNSTLTNLVAAARLHIVTWAQCSMYSLSSARQ